MRSPARLLLILVFAYHGMAGPFMPACYSIQRSQGMAHARSEAFVRYDCTKGGKLGTIKLPPYIHEAIQRAKEILRNCKACREVFANGIADPITKLNELEKDKAFVMAKKVPTAVNPNTGMIMDYSDIPSWHAAQTISLRGQEHPTVMTCIYINATATFMSDDAANRNIKPYNLPLIDARAVIILHELGHVTDAIQLDTIHPRATEAEIRESERKSIENTECILKNCDPCALGLTPCPGAPRRRRTAESKRFP
jgi:hypothetical protein